MSRRYSSVRRLPARRSTSVTASGPPNAFTRASRTALNEHEKWSPRLVSGMWSAWRRIIGYVSVLGAPSMPQSARHWTNDLPGADSVPSLDLRPSGAADEQREHHGPGDRYRGAARAR